MAKKRMFTIDVIDSDAFLDMPASAQCLYFHLNMRADDDGFVGNPKKIMRVIGGREDDLRILIAKRFILTFEDGVIVIKHWRMHNCISQNRYHETRYTDEKRMLFLKDNNAYSLTHGEPINDTKLVKAQSGAAAVLEDKEINEESTKKPKRNDYPDDFEEFWAEYPKKADKGMAYKKYQARIKSGFSPEELRQAARNYRMECEREHKNPQYIKHAKTFLGDATPFVDYLEKRQTAETKSTGNADFSQYL